MKTLIFEGAGWEGADVSKATDVSNCRIRTKLRNNKGRVIYLEIICGHYDKKNKHIPTFAEGLNNVTFIDAVFYMDVKWDNRRNVSKKLSPLTDVHFEYNKANILKFVNEKLDCSFDSIEVDNNMPISACSSKEPLCDCSNGDYEIYKDIEINISELDGVKPVNYRDGRNFADYKISYNSLMKLPYMKKYFDSRELSEIKKIQQGNNTARFRWNQSGVIIDLELHAGVCMGVGAEDVQTIIELIKADNMAVLTT